jgi:anti-anti-sigma regulatory factor/DNA-directed RNA polymerase subunit RPC12/RpoP
MLNIIKERVGDTLSIRLNGSFVGECVNLETLVGPTPAHLRVCCKNLVRLNSNGVRAWMKFFQTVQQRGTKVTLAECSPAVVDKMNAFRNFSCGAKVESIYVPYYCAGCKRELVGLFGTEELARTQMRMPNLKCPSCGIEAEFDDLPDQYFGFIEREFSVRAAVLPPSGKPVVKVSQRAVSMSNLQEPSMILQRPPQEEASRILRRVAG